MKNPSEKWGGLGGKSLRTICAVVAFVAAVVFVLCFCFVFFFYSYIVEFLAASNCRVMFWKKVVLKIFKFNNQQLVSRQNILRYTWEGLFFVRF